MYFVHDMCMSGRGPQWKEQMGIYAKTSLKPIYNYHLQQ